MDDTLPDRTGMRLHGAGFQETCHLSDFDWSASDRHMLDAAFSLAFLAMNEHVMLMRTAGAGKSSLAHGLGYPAVRAGHTVHFIHADDYLRVLNQDRVDNSLERNLRSFLSSALLLRDDLGLQRYAAQQSVHLCQGRRQSGSLGRRNGGPPAMVAVG